jgi:7-cyano-7-deazaguanine synthase
MKSLIVCSGGLDSVCMALIKVHEKNDVTLLTFNYGQKATNEIDACSYMSKKYNLNHIIADISSLSWIFGKENQLTNSDVDVKDNYDKSIVVPLRNGVFLQMALTYAYSNGFDEVVLGSHLNDCELKQVQCSDHNIVMDYGFPDCTPDFFKAMEYAASVGTNITDKKVKVVSASTLGLYKADLIKEGHLLDSDVLFRTWSCYINGDKQCGVCDSCRNRKKSFMDCGIEDKTSYLQ